MPLRIKEFDPEKEDWRDYVEQIEQYFIAHDLSGDGELVSILFMKNTTASFLFAPLSM